MLLKNIINTEIDKNKFFDVISITPLKYFIVDIRKNNFILEPIFPFINYCMSRYINQNDCDNYFNQKKYENISFLSQTI